MMIKQLKIQGVRMSEDMNPSDDPQMRKRMIARMGEEHEEEMPHKEMISQMGKMMPRK